MFAHRRFGAVLAAAVCLVVLAGFSPSAAQDQIAIYWDAGLTQNQTDTSAPFELVHGYLVIHDPTVGGGILGWECRLTVDGPGLASNWSLSGQAINAAAPPEFVVGLAEPLPPAAATVIATFDLFVERVEPVRVGMLPRFNASLEGRMSYLGGDQPALLTPLEPITGNEVLAEVNGGVPVAEYDRTTIVFGDVPIGQAVTEQVTVSNVGGGVLVLDVALDCDDPDVTLVSPAGTIGVAGGESVIVAVRYEPRSVGSFECALRLGSEAVDLYMSGSGREPVVSWTTSAPADFGTRIIGSVYSRSIWITNTGEIPLDLNVDWNETCGHFTVYSGAGPSTLSVGATKYVTLRFFPQTPGIFACDLAWGPGLGVIAVTGAAEYAESQYTLVPSTLDFGVADVGVPTMLSVELTNTGAYPFAVTPSIFPTGSAFTVDGEGQEVVLAPGVERRFDVTFTPSAEEYYSASLQLVHGIGPVPLSGIGGTVIRSCSVSADSLNFVLDNIGDSASQPLQVTNLGNTPLDVQPVVTRPEFTVTGFSGMLIPGQTANLTVTYTALTLAPIATVLDLGPDVCSDVVLTGRLPIGIEPGENQLGFYFDEEYTAYETGVGAIPAVLPAYLVLHRPSDLSGVAGWECRVNLTGEAVFSEVRLEGNAINAAPPHNTDEYAVGLGGSPVPYAADGLLLATFTLLVTDPVPDNVSLELRPLRQPSLAGLMAWVPWSDPSQLTPMVTPTGSPTVAWLDSSLPVGLELPTPRAVVEGRRVELSWTPHLTDADGYHVYRRGETGPAVRLTGAALPPTATLRYADSPAVSEGARLHYSYAAVKSGVETGRSPEVTVDMPRIPIARTELLPNVPNPFNPETRIRYRMAESGHLRITVYDVTGRRVRTLFDGPQVFGEKEVVWRGERDDGRTVASGTYHVRLEANGTVDQRKVTVVK